jgi:hypothetical protein
LYELEDVIGGRGEDEGGGYDEIEVRIREERRGV